MSLSVSLLRSWSMPGKSVNRNASSRATDCRLLRHACVRPWPLPQRFPTEDESADVCTYHNRYDYVSVVIHRQPARRVKLLSAHVSQSNSPPLWESVQGRQTTHIMTKYATVNCAAWNSALTICCHMLGRNGPEHPDSPLVTILVPPAAAAAAAEAAA